MIFEVRSGRPCLCLEMASAMWALHMQQFVQFSNPVCRTLLVIYILSWFVVIFILGCKVIIISGNNKINVAIYKISDWQKR